ncbi:MAG: translesion DNA synthesis-associated protein ImuA [Burkholderiales bacterium]|nr:translesion DNA synthesis-associated protein ImuA [Burkholderiales bacterium]MDE1927723.1 translesion DNA synthesis-associated protein ImuA [Burkholderiales bacterium]MDE2159300.1 translesion DNA synthesis-associated protein ImuA [Burkholderiales bacterium]MDE2504962.1 translesion DNA synthesis-associated protein ImuA [Burkholderiales bacterium]
MPAVLAWAGDDDEPVPASLPSPRHRIRGRRSAACAGEFPPAVEAAIWRGSELGTPVAAVLHTGFAALDAELPGHGWPCHALTEVLQPQPTVAEWRLLGAAMRQVVAAGRDIVVVGPPKSPHLPGLQHLGIDERRLVWIQADAPAQRLWVTEQLVKANAAGLLVSWLPQARQEQIRRLQVCSQSCAGPVFLCRPAAAAHEASAAPLRVQLRFGLDWELELHILKRKGPAHEGVIRLASVPGGLESILTPRLRKPSAIVSARKARESLEPLESRALDEVSHAVGSPAPRRDTRRRIGAH